LPSGMQFRTEIRDIYRLNDGTLRVQPQYDNALIGYQFPGDNDPATLHATFPVQPLALFGPDELQRATILVDVLLPNAFTGALLQESGGQITVGPVPSPGVPTPGARIHITAEPGDVIGRQAIELRLLDP